MAVGLVDLEKFLGWQLPERIPFLTDVTRLLVGFVQILTPR